MTEIVPEPTNRPKTFREFIDAVQRFPRGRRIIVYVSTLGFFVLPVALFFAYRAEVGFVTELALAFLWFLLASHAHYASEPNLSQRKVRRIDYWYLGAATIGLFLFAVGYTGQRDLTLSRMSVKVHQEGEAPFRSDVEKSAAYLSEFLCGSIAKFSAQPCEGIKRIAAEIRPNLSAEQIDALEGRFRNEVTLPYGGLFTLEKLREKPSIFSSLSVFEIRLESWRDYMKGAPKFEATAKGLNEEAEIMLGLGQWVVWPFVLAYALALRITKVTIDVFEWAR
ncbi:hypothetical protein JJC00_19775 [Bradyrhizobium diazoefficiens]|uniref:hypothetical protein n=1 Tax=Bradyrhizobium diazoefficiens TaxID=1355477 RepID=UPI00190A6887|nr:hypothetical protein [Bradyrhizobium diazoefficiens]QQO30913.1 hypothetical protein JJC00_19775 [Bradyrhizobium diazoefficiens]